MKINDHDNDDDDGDENRRRIIMKIIIMQAMLTSHGSTDSACQNIKQHFHASSSLETTDWPSFWPLPAFGTDDMSRHLGMYEMNNMTCYVCNM